jgi:hypothetical protein
MNRRSFLTLAAASAAALAVDPERLLWTPGKRVTFDLWTPPPPLHVGDFVVFGRTEAGVWGRHSEDGQQWVFVRTKDVTRITPGVDGGRAGVVTSVTGKDAKVMVQGAFGPYLLAHPFVDGSSQLRFVG